MKKQDKNVALVHDFLLYWGGAESVLREIGEVYKEAPIYTLLKREEFVKECFSDREVETSFLQKWPNFLKKRHKYLLPFFGPAVESFNLRDFDLVISSSSGFAKGIVIKPKTTHVCYMHAPMRYVWDWHHRYLAEQKLKGKMKLGVRMLLNYLRMWDRASAARVDYFVANSKFTQERIRKYYGRDSKVIYPPVEVKKFTAQKENKGYFLTVGRLSPYKNMRLIVEAFQKLKLPLVVVGDGEEREELKKMVEKDDQIQIRGWVDSEELVKIYQNARGFICACEDDFNITAVEAMAAGKPVIALRRGGVAETVIEGETGEFFDNPTLEMVADGVRRFIEKENSYDFERIRRRAEEFGKERFRREFREYIDGLR